MNRILGCFLAIGCLLVATGVALQIVQKPINVPPPAPVQVIIQRPVPVTPPALLVSTPVVVNGYAPPPKKIQKRPQLKVKKHFLPQNIASKLHVLLPGVPIPAVVQVSTNSAR